MLTDRKDNVFCNKSHNKFIKWGLDSPHSISDTKVFSRTNGAMTHSVNTYW